MSPEEARPVAVRQFGNATRVEKDTSAVSDSESDFQKCSKLYTLLRAHSLLFLLYPGRGGGADNR
jgi:hypothetical protein